MAKRPAWTIENGKIIRKDFEFAWNGGFAISQKRKNINALHQAIEDATGQTALEISSKGEVELGNQLSAFNMKTTGVFIENVFQASKRYENGGPYLDLLDVAPKDAKRDERHKISGKLVAFVRNGEDWPLEPKTVFYDYIYVLAVIENFGCELDINEYNWFTDIEFDSVVKKLPANAGDMGLAPGSGRNPGGGHRNPIQNPMDRGAWPTVRSVAKYWR